LATIFASAISALALSWAYGASADERKLTAAALTNVTHAPQSLDDWLVWLGFCALIVSGVLGAISRLFVLEVDAQGVERPAPFKFRYRTRGTEGTESGLKPQVTKSALKKFSFAGKLVLVLATISFVLSAILFGLKALDDAVKAQKVADAAAAERA